MKLFIASDHAGYELKEQIKTSLPDVEWTDLGTLSKESVHYPDYARKLAEAVIASKLPLENPRGVLICGSGIGVSIAANRYPQIRAALSWNAETAQLAGEHNRANVLCLPARFISSDQAREMIVAWSGAKFQGGRHAERVAQLGELPKPLS